MRIIFGVFVFLFGTMPHVFAESGNVVDQTHLRSATGTVFQNTHKNIPKQTGVIIRNTHRNIPRVTPLAPAVTATGVTDATVVLGVSETTTSTGLISASELAILEKLQGFRAPREAWSPATDMNRWLAYVFFASAFFFLCLELVTGTLLAFSISIASVVLAVWILLSGGKSITWHHGAWLVVIAAFLRWQLPRWIHAYAQEFEWYQQK